MFNTIPPFPPSHQAFALYHRNGFMYSSTSNFLNFSTWAQISSSLKFIIRVICFNYLLNLLQRYIFVNESLVRGTMDNHVDCPWTYRLFCVNKLALLYPIRRLSWCSSLLRWLALVEL